MINFIGKCIAYSIGYGGAFLFSFALLVLKAKVISDIWGWFLVQRTGISFDSIWEIVASLLLLALFKGYRKEKFNPEELSEELKKKKMIHDLKQMVWFIIFTIIPWVTCYLIHIFA